MGSRQRGLRPDKADSMNLKRIAQREGRNERDVIRDSLHVHRFRAGQILHHL